MGNAHLEPKWKAWVDENIRRGCSSDELFRILLEHGFDSQAARKELSRGRTPRPQVQAPGQRADSPLLELYTAEGFLTGQEGLRLIGLMRGYLRPSTISTPDEPDKFFRRSKTCDMSHLDHPAVRELDARICATMQIDPAYSEPMQGQHYEIDDEFKPHTDYFESHEIERFSTATLGQRTWTFMIYLNEPGGGGETAFVHPGIVLQPKTGMAVIWNNLSPGGQPNPNTLHHGMPVKAGYKAIITKWFRRPRD